MLESPHAKSISQMPYADGGFSVAINQGGAVVQKRFCGLLDSLTAACYSNYDYEEAKKLASIPPAQKRATGLTAPWQGRQRGRMLHHQIRAYTNAGGLLTMRALSANTAVPSNKHTALAEKFLKSLRALHLIPARAEFALYYESLSLASAIDLLCVHRHPQTGRLSLSLIEVKCGYDNSFLDGTGALTAPASLSALFNNSPRTQAFLQLGFYRQMVRHNFPDVEIGPCYVAQVRTNDTVYHQLPQTVIAAMPDVLAHVSAVRFRTLELAKTGRKRSKSSSSPSRRRSRKLQTAV
jgi:hypothetical protein